MTIEWKRYFKKYRTRKKILIQLDKYTVPMSPISKLWKDWQLAGRIMRYLSCVIHDAAAVVVAAASLP